jgi:CRP-like cAMP-binding protein
MKPQEKRPFDLQVFLAKADKERTVNYYAENQVVFSQGDVADALFHIQKGRVNVTVVSRSGQEAIIAILGAGDFLGEECMAGQQLRMATATTMSTCSIKRLDKSIAIKLLGEDSAFTESFFHYLLSRKIRVEEDLLDHHFNSSEKRLARTLLQLANFGAKDEPKIVIPKISQETLAAIVGTTRSRVSLFMNKFRKLGLIDYKGRVRVHSSLQNIVLQ